jgi:glycosyltransferase involved in cell wall biosynthesis
MINVTYIISNVDQSFFFEQSFKLIDKSRFNISVILLNPNESKLEKILAGENIYYKRINYRGKKDYPKALFRCISLLRKLKTDIVHAHLIDAGLLGLTAAYLAGVKNRIYTRHGGSQKTYFKRGVKHDKAINFLATHIIATCKNVKQILIEEEKVPSGKISIVNLAFDSERFSRPDTAIIEKLKTAYNPNNRRPVVGVISRFVEWKGIQYIIPAFRRFLDKYPNALLILANANGNYTGELQKMISEFKPEEIKLISFEKNFYELYKLFDFFVHVPVAKQFEAFGQIYIESLAAGIPSVFTMAGIAPEIIKDRYNALVVDFKNSQQIFEALDTLQTNSCLRQQLIQNGKQSIESRFDIAKVTSEMELLYTNKYSQKK